MKTQKNIRIILTPVDKTERKDLENIENQVFKSVKRLEQEVDTIFNGDNPNKAMIHILTIDEFRKHTAFTDIVKSFNLAVSNIRKRKQCYKLTDFMDDFNNDEFKDNASNFWMGYVRVNG